MSGSLLDSMAVEIRNDIAFLSPEDIAGIHRDIIESDSDADSGLINRGSVDFAIDYIKNGYFGECPETIHDKATHLMRLLAANHAFTDGNKRTALNATWTFYFINGYYFDYGEEIKAVLKLYAVMEQMVDTPEVADHFSDIAIPIEDSDIISQNVQNIFAKQRGVAERFKEAESLLQGTQDIDDASRVANILEANMSDLQDVGDAIESDSVETNDLIQDILSEQIDWLNEIIDDLMEMYGPSA